MSAPEGPRQRYQVLEPLGVGGMAEVFKARLTGSAGFQRDVVLKRLRGRNLGDPAFAGMLADEARLLGFLRHPNVVQALDFYEEGGQLFLVLEYVEGPSLSGLLRDGRDIPPAIVAYIGREIGRALDYVHGVRAMDGTPLRVVHQDVTPSNIVLTPDGAVKLLDFGVARFAYARQWTGDHIVKGKLSYLAPEQLRAGHASDGRVDLFALGIVLHELLTGKRLFRGEDDVSTLRNVATMKIAPPSRARRDVPRALERVVMRALERDPADRYQSAAAMVRDLDEVVLASRLRVAEVAAFARAIEAPVIAASREPFLTTTRVGRAPAGDEATRRDLRLPLAMWMKAIPGGRRSVLVAGLGLALSMGTLGFVRLSAHRAPLVTPTRPPALECAAPLDVTKRAAPQAPPLSTKVSVAAAL